MQQDLRKEGHHKGWDDRKFQYLNIIEEAIRQSRNFKEFAQVLGEKIKELEMGMGKWPKESAHQRMLVGEDRPVQS